LNDGSPKQQHKDRIWCFIVRVVLRETNYEFYAFAGKRESKRYIRKLPLQPRPRSNIRRETMSSCILTFKGTSRRRIARKYLPNLESSIHALDEFLLMGLVLFGERHARDYIYYEKTHSSLKRIENRLEGKLSTELIKLPHLLHRGFPSN